MEISNAWVAVAAVTLGLGSFASAVSIYRHMNRKPEGESVPSPAPDFWKRGGAWVVGQVVLIGIILSSPFLPSPAGWSWAIPFRFPGNLVACIFAVPGVFFLVSGFVSLGPNLTALPAPIEGGRHVATGIYRLIRHPIYSGLLSLTFAYACLWNGALPLLAFLPLAILLHFKSRAEETFLKQTYPEYETYRSRTKALIPWIL